MSESKFVEDKVRSFRRKYQPKDGWSVWRLSYPPGIDLLPALLRHRQIEASTDVWARISLHSGPRSRVFDLQSEAIVTKGPGLSDGPWFGTLKFVWNDVAIVIERHPLEPSGLSDHEVLLAASKDRAALNDLSLTLDNFWRTIYITPREIQIVNGGGSIPLPRLGWADLILPEQMAAEIKANVESFFSARASYSQVGLPYRRGFLFIGPPGGGKTTAVKIILSNAGARPLALSLRDQMKDSMIEAAFEEAARQAPAILLIEDLDKLVQSKSVSMSCLLNLLDGLDTYEGFLLIATSNEPEKIDKALLHRPSRFDRVWHFGLPGVEERRRLLALRGQGRFSGDAIAEAAEAAAGFTMAYVQEVVVNSMLSALHEGREPQDADLLDSVRKLGEQYRAGQKATGDLRPVQRVGFGSAEDR